MGIDRSVYFNMEIDKLTLVLALENRKWMRHVHHLGKRDRERETKK